LLARTPVVSDEVMSRFEQQARELGFELDEMVLVSHEQP
jgi:lipocalin